MRTWRKYDARTATRTVVCVALAGLCLAGYQWAPSAVAGLMTVRHVSIAGTARLDRRDVLALLDLPVDSSLLSLERAELERRVEAHPWVASASVGRALPHTLSVIVVERIPAAVVRDADGEETVAVLVDDEGVVLMPAPAPASASASASNVSSGHLPELVGASVAGLVAGDVVTRTRVRRAIDFASALRRRFGRAVTVDMRDARFLSGHAAGRVVLAPNAFERAWRRYLELEPSLPDGQIRRSHELDLRFVGKVIVRQKG